LHIPKNNGENVIIRNLLGLCKFKNNDIFQALYTSYYITGAYLFYNYKTLNFKQSDSFKLCKFILIS